jgi:UDP:flavonoid glycosyltransferase YjiC (YdhE family)
MRAMFVTAPAMGHLHPLVPLALAMRDAGDDVVVAGAPSVCARAEEMGLAGAPAGPELDQWFAALQSRVRGAPGDGLPPERILGYFLPRLFGECGAPVMVDDLVPLIDRWRPHLIVYETMAFAAPLAAALAKVPAVHHTVSPLGPPDLWALCADAVSPLWRSLDMTPSPHAGLFDGLTLATWPPSLDPADDYGATDIGRMRAVPLDATGGERLPRWVKALAERPTVYMTLGTVTNTDIAVFRAAVDGLAHEPVNLILTVGRDNDPTALGPLPPNARAERYIPQSLLLPHCTAVISHAGSGTTLAALTHGLPQLLIPQGADQFVNAERCEQAGVGARLLPDQVTAAAVRDALAAMLQTDSTYRRQARRVQEEMASMPTPEQWVEPLRALTRTGYLQSGTQPLSDPALRRAPG